MKGLLLYNQEDYERNKDYVHWLQEEAEENRIDLQLALKEEFLIEGVPRAANYRFVINRTRSYEISLMFQLNNIRAFNHPEITLLGNNKLAAYLYAKNKGIQYPEILVSWSQGEKIISKPNDGHGGQGVGLLRDVNLYDGNIRLQQAFMEDLIGDIRFYILNNKIIHAVLRRASNKIISNFSQGGEISLYDYNAHEKAYVEAFIKDLVIDYAGVDFLLTKDKKLVFNEIEDVVGSRMLSKLGVNNTTKLFLQHIKATVPGT
ncbi:gamma-F420-2:alpha-L-glutamate ligase [Natronincola peptidivorans]|uniref:Gamma-F420-2:alpha-L-glutamate ligase n=1 Tax=Natronincola peptidivorans TaxID=426128 RepID=A0A1H9ZKR8_9FIRM|nr:ATP-grasp domain-containing protein [Natronincola peptidivorans]SES81390.1 gamma-F420-2:alpha-L-glutamate ligase [Natronincola peptidivorans]